MFEREKEREREVKRIYGEEKTKETADVSIGE
jgi:hypothetical protein